MRKVVPVVGFAELSTTTEVIGAVIGFVAVAGIWLFHPSAFAVLRFKLCEGV